MVRILIGLLIGLIAGALGTIHYLSSGHGNVQLMTSPQIHQLEVEVKQSHQQIEVLTKKLEDAAATMEKTAARFGALEQQIEALRPSADPSSTKPMAEEPPTVAPTQPTDPPSPS